MRLRSLLALSFLAAARASAQQLPPAAEAGVRTSVLDRIVAVVANKPLLYTELLEAINEQRAGGLQVPTDSAGQIALMRKVLDEIIDIEVLVNVAKQYKADVTDEDVARQVDQRFNEIKGRFPSENDFRNALRPNGFASVEEFRKSLKEQAKRFKLQQIGIDSMRAHGRLSAPVQVTEKEITDAFAAAKARLGKRPPTVSFRQIVVAPKPNAAARNAARAKAESLLVELTKGGDFATIAKRESMDPSTKETGGDLGWNRRGSGLVPEFERWLFGLNSGQMSPVVETTFGFHIIRVDQRTPAEVKGRHILIAPKIDSADAARARVTADTVLRLWKAGTSYDTLVARYHDPAELKSLLDAVPIDSTMPEAYQKAIQGVAAKDWTKPFEIYDARLGQPKFGILQIIERSEGGDYTVADVRDRIKSQLQGEKQMRRAIDQLKREQFVKVLLNDSFQRLSP